MLHRRAVSLVLFTAAAVSPTLAHAQVRAPHLQDFESAATCSAVCGSACDVSGIGWTNESGDGGDWTVHSGPTTTANSGPSADHTLGTAAGRYLYTEASDGCSTSTFSLRSPALAPETGTFARFWYHMRGATMGDLHVDVLDAALSPLALDVIPPITDDRDAWQQTPPIDLRPYIGQTVHIRLRGVTGSRFWSDMAIDDFELIAAPRPADMGVTAIAMPATVRVCGTNGVPVTITIHNFGFEAQRRFPVAFRVDGGPWTFENVLATIPPLESRTFTFSARAAVSGAHSIEATTALGTDSNPANDRLTTSVTAAVDPVVTTFPYLDDFEGPATWVSSGTGDEWELGAPSTSNLMGAFSGVNAWVTDLDDTYSPDARNELRAQRCFDLSGLTRPAVRLAVAYDIESYDGAVLQSSVDGGASWQTVGDVGTGPNWYDDDDVVARPGGQALGWNRRAPWRVAAHSLASLAGEPEVRFRVAFASDSSVQRDGFALDDFEVFDDVVPGIAAVGDVEAVSLEGQIASSTHDLPVLRVTLTAQGGDQTLDALSLTRRGTVPDAALTAKVYLDDGDGAFGASDTLLGAQPFTAGAARVALAQTVEGLRGEVVLFVALDVLGALAGGTVGVEVVAPSTDLEGSAPVTASGSFRSVELTTVSYASGLPFDDDFSSLQSHVSATRRSRERLVWDGSAATWEPNGGAAGVVTREMDWDVTPAAGSHALVSRMGPSAAGASEHHFDLSGHSVSDAPLWLRVVHGDAGDFSDAASNRVFVSVDGGETWPVSAYAIPDLPSGAWAESTVDLSAALRDAGLDYTDRVVLRVQRDNASSLGPRTAAVDRVTIGRGPRAVIDRGGAAVADEGLDAMGDVGVAPQSVMYTITNTGHLPLPLSAEPYEVVETANVTGITVTPPTESEIPAGGSATFQVDFEPLLGAFRFSLRVPVEDAVQTDGVYAFRVEGTGVEVRQEIDVQRPVGASIASGRVDLQGVATAGEVERLSYTVANVGFGVDLTGVSAQIERPVNVSASLVGAPDATIAAGGSTTVDVDYEAAAEGAWSFDLVIESDDADESRYVIHVEGVAVSAPEPDAGVPDAGPSEPTDAGSPDAGADAGPGEMEDPAGCSCAAAGATPRSTPVGLGLLVAALGLTIARRRRRRAR